MANDSVWCKQAMKALYLDWVSYYKVHGSPRSEKKMKKVWNNWNRTVGSRELKKELKQECKE